jgi:ketosteroid isomerase-like protein
VGAQPAHSDRFLHHLRCKDPRQRLFKPTSLTIQDVKVMSYRDTAIITGIDHAKGTYQNKPYDHVGRFTDTWVYDTGKWRCVASHTGLIKVECGSTAWR